METKESLSKNWKTKNYLLREIPAGLHKKIKIRAAEEGVPMRDWILKILERALEERSQQTYYRRDEK